MPREEGASELRNSRGHLLKVGVPGNELAGCYASYWRMSIDYVIDEEGVAQTPITRNKPTSISAYALIQGTAGSASEAFTPSIKMEIQPRQNMHKQSTEQRSSKVLRWQSFPRGVSPHDNAMSSYCGELMPPRSPFSLKISVPGQPDTKRCCYHGGDEKSPLPVFQFRHSIQR
jgi:hypothetical protein